MELILEVISRIVLVGYFFITLLLVGCQIQVRLLSNAQYITYSNYVKEKNMSQYESKTKYYKTVIKGISASISADVVDSNCYSSGMVYYYQWASFCVCVTGDTIR